MSNEPAEIIKVDGTAYRLAAICISDRQAQRREDELEEKTGYRTVTKLYGDEHCVYLEEAHSKRRFM